VREGVTRVADRVEIILSVRFDLLFLQRLLNFIARGILPVLGDAQHAEPVSALEIGFNGVARALVERPLGSDISFAVDHGERRLIG